MTSSAARLAELHSAENLVACYVREVSRPADEVRVVAIDAVHELRLRLADRRHELRVHVTRPTLLGGFTVTSMPRIAALDGDMSIRALDVQALTEILLDDLAQRRGEPSHPELATLVADSRRVLERILAAQTPAATSAQRSSEAGTLAAEQSLVFGHPYHPSPKARLGFSPSELVRHSPELGARFRLHLVSARRDLTVTEGVDATSFEDCVENAIGAKLPLHEGHVLVPVHPFQARHLRETPEGRLLLDRGDLVDLGPHGDEVWALSSVRTVQRPGADYALKPSLDVRVTNCIRRNAVHEMQSALQVTRWMKREAPRLQVIAPRFSALDEVAFVSLLPRADLPSLGVIVRDVVACRAATPSAEPVVAASLFGDRHLGRERLARLLPKPARARFFRGYLEALVVPTLHLFFEVGLMFEPHLQNVLVTVPTTSEDLPRAVLRDFDNCKVVDDVFDPARLLGLPTAVVDELRTPIDKAWDRFVYCLFVNDVAEVAAALADGDSSLERALARDAADVVAAFRDRTTNPRARTMLDALLSARTLPAKANLLTRAFKLKDRDAPFVGVPNPLREALRTTVTTPTPTRATLREDSGL